MYLCTDRETDEERVVKLTCSDDPAKLYAAMREYKLLTKVPMHQNIVQVHDQFVNDHRNTVHTIFENAGIHNL